MQRVLATNVTDFTSGDLGLVELVATYLQDRQLKRWSKGELIVYINEAQDELAQEINRAYKSYFVKSATVPTVSGQSLYSLPTDLIELVKLEVVDSPSSDTEPQSLTEVLLNDKRFYEVLDQANQKTSFGYYFLQGGSFRALPEVGTSNAYFRMFYVKRLAALSADADLSEIPGEHHGLLALKAAQHAWAKNGRQNGAIDTLAAEKLSLMRSSIEMLSRYRVSRRRPWRGGYGPRQSLVYPGSVD